MAIDVGRGILTIQPDFTQFNQNLNTQIPGLLKDASRQSLVLGAALTASISAPIAILGKQAADAAISFEAGLAGIAKTVGAFTSIKEAGVIAIGDELADIARTTPIAAEELLRIGEIAGQLGVAPENISAFAEKVAQLAISTDLTAESAAFSLARFGNVLGEGTGEIDKYADALVALGNQFPTTESSILSLAARVAGSGATVGLASEDILALSAALSSVGVAAELGGTAISRVIVSIAGEVASGGEKLKTFAKVAGQSAESFAQQWKDEPAEALLAFIKGLNQMQAEGGPVFQTLDDLGFGAVRVRDVLLRAAGAADLFEDSMVTARTATGQLDNEFAKFAETTRSKLQVAQNNIRDGFRQIGENALPVLVTVQEALGKLVQGLANIPGPFQKFLGLFVALAGLAGPVLATFGGVLQAAASIALIRQRNREATLATEQLTVANTRLASSYTAVQLASTKAASGIAATSGAALAAAGTTVGRASPYAAAGLSGQVANALTFSATAGLGTRLARRLKPTLSGIGKGLGVAFATSLAAGAIEAIPREQGSIGDKIGDTLSGALGAGAIGATVGSIFPVIGTGLGFAAGALIGGVTSFFKSDEVKEAIVDGVTGQADQSQAELVRIGQELGVEFGQGLVAAETLDPAFEKVLERFLEAAKGISANVQAYAEARPSIFGVLFDDKKVKEAAESLDFSSIQATVAENLADLDEISAVISDLTSRGLYTLADEIVQQGGPAALAAARSVREQLLTDPDSVFQLEADLLRLKPGLDEAFVNLLKFPETGGVAPLDISEGLLARLLPEDREAITKPFEDEVSATVESLARNLAANETALADQLAVGFKGPIGSALQVAIKQAFTETEFSIDPTTITSVITASFGAADLEQALTDALTTSLSGQFIELDIGDENVLVTVDDLIAGTLPADIQAAAQPFLDELFVDAETDLDKLKLIAGQTDIDLTSLAVNISQRLTTALNDPAFAASLAPSVEGATQAEIFDAIITALAPSVDLFTAEEVASIIFPEGGVTIDLSEGINFTVPESLLDVEDLARLKKPGNDIALGLYEGMNSDETWEFIKGAMSTRVGEIEDTLRTDYEMSSPSQVFAKVGADIVGGINQGLESDIGGDFITRMNTLIVQAFSLGKTAGSEFLRGVNNSIGESELEFRLPSDSGSGSRGDLYITNNYPRPESGSTVTQRTLQQAKLIGAI